MGNFDFNEFLESIKDLEKYEILVECNSAIYHSENLLASWNKGKLKKIYASNIEKLKTYIIKLKDFSFFLANGREPYKGSYLLNSPVIQKLIEKGYV